MNTYYKKLLILKSIEFTDNQIELGLKKAGYEITTAANVEVVVERIVTQRVDLIICPRKLNGESGFSIFKRLRPYLLTSAVPFFLFLQKYDEKDIMIGLEMGIDNFIFIPIDIDSVIRKINRVFYKKTELNVFTLKHFKKYFSKSDVPMFFLDGNEVACVNEAFKKLVKCKSEDMENQRFDWLFSIANNEENEYHYRQFVDGVTEICKLKEVTCCSTNGVKYNINLHRGNQFDIRSAFAEILPLNNDFAKVNSKSDEKEALSRLDIAKEKYGLTKRELEVFHLSANGLTVKELAAELRISERTVEKHRANIRRKTQTRSILETMWVIDSNY
ncbi:LuxR C-terminal-related transcriptional regulator [Draconibacterium orientale]|uniref:response regulator transcription factor n=1 Tax=Draconibacterium orientale TaxID=1168034 RepID=UPI002ABE5F1B|nr:LuxR C-terminal-related transcriptional regulator [Draconibacterium orientale]